MGEIRKTKRSMTTLLRADSRAAQAQKVIAFTLIEMLVVISIIGILAALILGVYPAAHEKKVRSRVKAEMAAIETVIESYKEKKGFYPPDNLKQQDGSYPPLYFELTSEDLPPNPVRAQAETLGLTNIVNLAPAEDSKNFFPNVRQSQIFEFNGVRFLGVKTRAPDDADFVIWHYDTRSDGRHNHESFDLWVDCKIGGKTVRLGNWND
jgi:prepilin-type N-terminal cleavage/methylation domain-containing protein